MPQSFDATRHSTSCENRARDKFPRIFCRPVPNLPLVAGVYFTRCSLRSFFRAIRVAPSIGNFIQHRARLHPTILSPLAFPVDRKRGRSGPPGIINRAIPARPPYPRVGHAQPWVASEPFRERLGSWPVRVWTRMRIERRPDLTRSVGGIVGPPPAD